MSETHEILRDKRSILDPAYTALIIVDMQVDFCDDDGTFAAAGRDLSAVKAIVPNIKALQDKAREKGVFIVQLQEITLPHRRSDGDSWYALKTRDGKSAEYTLLGSHGADIISELAPRKDEVVIQKFRSSGFHGTFLDQVLRANDIRSNLFVGTTTEGCVMATILDSSFHDYYTSLVSDGVATSVAGMQETALKFMSNRYKVYTTEEVIDIWDSYK